MGWESTAGAGTFLPVEKNRIVVFATSREGVYYFFAAIADGGKLTTAVHKLTIGKGKPPEPGPGPGPGPGPRPGPEPSPVPEDQWDNIGQRVQKWATDGKASPAVAHKLGDMYAELADRYTDLTHPKKLVTQEELVKETNRQKASIIPAGESDKWDGILKQVDGDLRPRWPLKREEFGGYMRAIGAGLRGVGAKTAVDAPAPSFAELWELAK